MKLEDIYESFFDTYRNMGYIISELSQRTLARAANLATHGAASAAADAAREDRKKDKNYKDRTALDLNAQKLSGQAAKFKTAARKKGQDNEEKARKRGGEAAAERARTVRSDIHATSGFENEKDVHDSQKKATKDATDRKRLRKRFKGELDG